MRFSASALRAAAYSVTFDKALINQFRHFNTNDSAIGQRCGAVGRINLALRFNTDYNTGADLDPLKNQGSFAVVDARIGLGPRDKHWSVELWAQNLLDQDYYQIKYNAPFQTGTVDGFLGQPRTFGATLRARY